MRYKDTRPASEADCSELQSSSVLSEDRRDKSAGLLRDRWMRPHEGIGEEIEPPLVPGGFDEGKKFEREVAEVVAPHVELFQICEA